jgi:uncharacterized membrane protein YqgA involved in biofilm formation
VVGGLIGAAVGRRLSARTLEKVASLVGVAAILSLLSSAAEGRGAVSEP